MYSQRPSEPRNKLTNRLSIEQRQSLVMRNARLAYKVAHRWYHGSPLARQIGEREDAVQVALYALVEAAEHFNPDRQTRFCTYAYNTIRHLLHRAVRQGGLIHIPASAVLSEKQDSDPAVREHVSRALCVAQWPRCFCEDDVGADVELAAAEGGTDPEDLREMLRYLPKRERKILERRFGLDGVAPETLAAIGRRLGLGRERVRQIQANALRRLRKHLASLGTEDSAARTLG